MNPICEACGGCCCKYFIIPYKMLFSSNKKWAEYHPGVTVTKEQMEIEIPCGHLKDGKCGCYEERPEVCRVHKVGGSMCVNAIRKMHTPEKQAELLEMLK